MTTSALLDLIMKHALDLNASDGNNTDLRERALARMQEIAEGIWDFHDWDFKFGNGTAAVSAASAPLTQANAVVDAPSDFFTDGEQCSLYVSGQRKKIKYKTPVELFKLREEEGDFESYPSWYTIAGATRATAATQLPKIWFYPGNLLAFTLNINNYAIKSPTLIDTTGSTNGLNYLPEDYHRTVVQRGVMKLLGFDSGDGRGETFDVWFLRELKRAKARRVNARGEAQYLGQEGGLSDWMMH